MRTDLKLQQWLAGVSFSPRNGSADSVWRPRREVTQLRAYIEDASHQLMDGVLRQPETVAGDSIARS